MDRELMERGREKQPAGDSGREDTPLPTRFGRNKRRPLPRPRLFGRYAGVSTTGARRTAEADDTRAEPPGAAPADRVRN